MGKGIVVVSRFDFTGDGMDIPYNTRRAARAWRAKNGIQLLFCSHSIEFRFVGFSLFLRGAYDPILVMCRGIDRIEF